MRSLSLELLKPWKIISWSFKARNVKPENGPTISVTPPPPTVTRIGLDQFRLLAGPRVTSPHTYQLQGGGPSCMLWAYGFSLGLGCFSNDHAYLAAQWKSDLGYPSLVMQIAVNSK